MADDYDSITITQDLDPYDYDGLWKDFTREFWQDILEDFMPDLYEAADLSRPAEQLDKELHDVLVHLEQEEDKSPKRYVDTLLKIYLKDGREEWILLHIEIQGRGGENISLRMFRYHCLLFIHHGKHPAAMAILTAKRPKKEGEPGKYTAELFGTRIEYKYNVVKAYELEDEELKARGTYPALFIYALKKAAEHKRSDREKYAYMKEILSLLIEKQKSDRIKRRAFIIYVERAINFSSQQFKDMMYHEVSTTLEGGEHRMAYKSIFIEKEEERYAQGLAQGVVQGVARGAAQANRDTAKALLGLGILSDEQIAIATKQTLEDIALLRQELQMP